MLTDPNRNNIFYTRKSRVSDEEMDLVADCLESLRHSTGLRPGLSAETKGELEQYLALAEAALRRAYAESKFS